MRYINPRFTLHYIKPPCRPSGYAYEYWTSVSCGVSVYSPAITGTHCTME